MHVLTRVDPAEIARLRERDEFFWIDLSSPDGRGGRAPRRGARPAPGRARGHARVRPAAEDRPVRHHLLLVFFTARATGDPTLARRADRGPHLPLRRLHGHRAARRVHAASTTSTSSSPSRSTHDEEILVYRLLDALTDAYYPVIDGARGAASTRSRARCCTDPQREQLRRSYRLKQCVHQLHRRVAAQRDQFQTRARGDPRARGARRKGSRPYLRDIGDHLVQIAGEFQRQIDDLTALTQTYFNANSDRLNRVATRLTDRRHAVHPLHRRDRLLRPELRLAGGQHRHQEGLPAVRRRRRSSSRP